jgi:hypothetical protein
VEIVPLSKVNTPGSSTMLQLPPGEKSTVKSAWKEPVPVDRLLVAFATTVTWIRLTPRLLPGAAARAGWAVTARARSITRLPFLVAM